MSMRFENYSLDGFYDEMFDEQGLPRAGTEAVKQRFGELPLEELKRRQEAAEKTLLAMSREQNESSPSISCHG